MNTILLQPTDVLFFRDGRPMTGSLAGHGAAWPLPNVINAAFHAALHRAQLDADGSQKLHTHRRGARGVYAEDAQRDRKFGSLITAGPFPVKDGRTWFFPRPQDLQNATLQPALLPADSFDSVQSSLPDPLEYAVANRLPPSKESGAKGWLAQAAYERYMDGSGPALNDDESLNDADFADTEYSIGIGIDPERQVQDGERFYSAHYLRLRPAWQLGVCAAAEDKACNRQQHGKDLIKALLNGGQHQIIVGGQQRICSARLADMAPPLPRGKADRFHEHDGRFLVKWILLSPAVWPAIEADSSRNISAHPGGWLPNWIHPQTGEVLLKAGDTARHEQDSRGAWRQRVRQQANISAKLVAAIVPKPLVITGWALPDEAAGEQGGAQSTHLAVPAGAVYYFEAGSADEARKLAAALNWHGSESNPTTIKNRRSTLLGEKGFGLGVCGTWHFFPDVPGRSGN
jgi:CRISPR/Cas system CMR-associated protein Cmr3 (group 5 of RAMP superfamily)